MRPPGVRVYDRRVCGCAGYVGVRPPGCGCTTAGVWVYNRRVCGCSTAGRARVCGCTRPPGVRVYDRRVCGYAGYVVGRTWSGGRSPQCFR
eukprot:5255740-Pyramimonas_sp.AAC.2